MSAPDQLDAIRARLAAATPGEWENDFLPSVYSPTGVAPAIIAPGYNIICRMATTLICAKQAEADADLIAHAPTDLAYLLDRVATLERENKELQEDITELRETNTELKGTQPVRDMMAAVKLMRTTSQERDRLAADRVRLLNVAKTAEQWLSTSSVAAAVARDLRLAIRDVEKEETK